MLLVAPILIDLSLLGYFKYTNFILESVGIIFNAIGNPVEVPILNIVLPVGISFYTFHTITYIVDCYRRVINPTKNIFEFAAYVSLFSQLVAGPIVRYGQIEADLHAIGKADMSKWLAKGIVFFVFGLLEKTLIADWIARLVDPAWNNAIELSSTSAWLAVLGYTFQLYFDFCGYSSMAVGLGFMFGMRIPQNFNSPYQASDPSDFWKRWHMSLSSCLRDYLYIPLGGNRFGALITNRNLLCTMLIGGIWHGANWTFVVWGLYHGLLLVLWRQFSHRLETIPRIVRQIVTFLLISFGWVFFRSTDLSTAMTVISKMFNWTAGTEFEHPVESVCVIAAAATLALFGPNVFDLFGQYKWRIWHTIPISLAFGVALANIVGTEASPFLYFQF